MLFEGRSVRGAAPQAFNYGTKDADGECPLGAPPQLQGLLPRDPAGLHEIRGIIQANQFTILQSQPAGAWTILTMCPFHSALWAACLLVIYYASVMR